MKPIEAQKRSCKHFPWHFSSEKFNLGQVWKFTFLLLSDTGAKLMTICIFNKAFEKPLLTVHMNRINLI